jgi:hypothetical protein
MFKNMITQSQQLVMQCSLWTIVLDICTAGPSNSWWTLAKHMTSWCIDKGQNGICHIIYWQWQGKPAIRKADIPQLCYLWRTCYISIKHIHDDQNNKLWGLIEIMQHLIWLMLCFHRAKNIKHQHNLCQLILLWSGSLCCCQALPSTKN